MAESTVWHQEQKTATQTEYYIVLHDGSKQVSFILKHDSATNSVQAEPYTPPDINYTIHDGCNHDEDYCVLEDPASGEYEDGQMASRYQYAVESLAQQVNQAKNAEAMIQRKRELASE